MFLFMRICDAIEKVLWNKCMVCNNHFKDATGQLILVHSSMGRHLRLWSVLNRVPKAFKPNVRIMERFDLKAVKNDFDVEDVVVYGGMNGKCLYLIGFFCIMMIIAVWQQD